MSVEKRCMSKKRIKRLQKIVSIFSALFLLIYSFTPYLVLAPVRAQSEDQTQTEVTAPQDGQSTSAPEVSSSTEPQPPVETTPSVTEEPTPTVEENVTPSDEQSPTQDNGPPADGSTSAEPTPVPSPEPEIEKVCLTDQTITDTTNDNWNIDIEKGTAETKDKVALGVKYIFPQENKVTITFKCLPKDEGLRTQLKIQKVKVSDLKLPEGVTPYGEWAYDITTGMADGNFEYEVTLPKPENKSAEVSYTEDVNSEVNSIDEGKLSQEGDKIKVNSLDHFTIFIATYSDNTFTVEKSQYYQGETVYVKAGDLNTNKYYRLAINPPGSSNTFYITPCFDPSTGNTTLTGSYNLPPDATESNNWKAELKRWNSSSTCSNDPNSQDDDDVFEVLATKSDLTAAKSNNVDDNATVGQAFTWTIHVANPGSGTAQFNNGEVILTDNLPSGPTYGSASVSNVSGVSGTISCSISSDNLSCTASGAVNINAGGSFDILWSATPTATGTLTNPIDGWWEWWSWHDGICKVDPNTEVTESAEDNNNCSDTVNVAAVQPVTNPTLPQSCGIDVGLVIDTSTSIDDGELATMKTAFNGFVSAFTGTPTRMAVVSFDDSAVLRSGFTSDLASLNSVINGINGDGYTNWEDALHDTRLLFPDRVDKPDLIVFTTDGDPTVSNADPNTNTSQPNQHLAPAIAEANLAKGSNIRIITLGIGMTSPASQTRLEQISSADAFYSAATFDELDEALHDLVTDLCGGTISVTKNVDGQPASGWTFTPTVTGGTATPLSSITNDNGQAIFTIDPSNGSATVDVAETVQSGYTLSGVSCTKNNQPLQVSYDTDSVNGLSLDDNDIVACTFNNTSNYIPTRICHATGSGHYNSLTPATIGVLMGHVGAGHQNGEDIIPPITVFLPLGQNWDATGQAIWDNGCVVPPQTGTLTVRKVVVDSSSGALGPESFYFNAYYGGGSQTSQYFEPDGQVDLVDIPVGGYNVTEDPESNYTTTYDNCNGTIVGGQTSICTITNTRDTGDITFEKQIVGTPTSLDAWTFTITGTNGTFTAKHGDIKSLPTGTYTVTESGGPANYHMFGASGLCHKSDSPEADLTVTTGGGTCTIINKRDAGSLIAQKLDENNQPVAGWKFKLNDGSWQVADSQGVVNFGELETGNYTVTEESRAGYYLSSVTSTGDFCQKIESNNNSAIATVPWSTRPVCVFKNIPIPKYEGPSTCPTDKPVKNLLGTYTVSATAPGGITVPVVTAGNSYLFEASGTFAPTSAPGYLSDAGYTWVSGSLSSQYGINGTPPDYGAHALLANLGNGVGIVNWGQANNVDHTYSVYYTPTNSSPQFVIGDRWSNWYGTPYDNQTGMGDNSGSLTLNVYECQNYGSISGRKWEDLNANHIWDEGESIVDGSATPVKIYVDVNNNDTYDNPPDYYATIDSEGRYSFGMLVPGDYNICEKDDSLTGWTRTFPVASSCQSVTVNAGEDSIANFGNRPPNPLVMIDKTNNTGGADQAPGNTVGYTITVTFSEGSVTNLQVTDLLPDGFTYNGGSYVVLLNGTPQAGLPEPGYASPGTWDLSLLGTLTPEDVVELQYTANIGGSQQQGLYKDLAWSEGQSLASIPVMARDVNDPTDPFVGTNVNVVTGQNTAASVSLNTKREETTTGEVLGASTGLPGTGGNTIWVVIASVLAALGGLLAGLGLALKKGFKLPSLKNLTRFAVLLAALFLFTTQTQAGFSPLSLRLSIPKSPSNLSSFNLTYVALDTGGSAVTVKCYKQGPSDGGFVQFGSDIVTAAGGNTGSCLVDSSILTTVGTYLFKATAETGGPVVDSDQIVSVDWNNNTNPGTPTGYSKGKLDTCTYQIKFRTADDSGKTVRAEVYRSINTSFSLDNSTRVADINVGSGTDVSINNVVQDCTVENFYAVRAFDMFGNGSGVIGDSGIIVTFTTTGATTTTAAAAGEVGGAIAVAGAGLPAETTQVLGTESAQPSGKPQEVGQPGESLGAAIARKGLFGALADYLKNPYISIPLVILVLVLVYVFTKKANKKPL